MTKSNETFHRERNPLWAALAALREQGKDVRPLRSRVGYYLVDGYVKTTSEIVRAVYA